jgi:hypothetical protein
MQLPPNGIMFEEKQTGWKSWEASPASQWDFNLCCREVQRHRASNPVLSAKLGLSTDIRIIQDQVDKQNAIRVSAIPGADIYLIQGGAPPPKAMAPPSQKRLAAVAEKVKKINAGSDLLLEWEESGDPPVNGAVAASRAMICATCPKNDSAPLTDWFTIPASELIRKRIARLNELKLSTPNDPELHTCTACLCPLKLKVHTPLHLILKHLIPEARNDLDPGCWIIHEAKP